MKKTVVLGITSGIAAYKMLDFIKLVKEDDVDIEVVMTASAARMLPPKDVEIVTKKKVFRDLFEARFHYKDILKIRKVDHVDLADRADVIVIAPATANVIAKLAHGIADDFLTTMVLAANSPLVLSPSMNVHMWHNPMTQENIKKLKEKGVIIIPPERGPLACGYEGLGRLPHLEKIKVEVMKQIAYSKLLLGKKILVTAGGTSERIDDARVISNRSSGKMGVAIAEECHLRGAEVILLRAKDAVEPRYAMEQYMFETSEDLRKLIEKKIGTADVIFHAAAVSDFIPEKKKGKLSSDKAIVLKLTPQQKIIGEIKKWNPRVTLIGFKALANDDKKACEKTAKEMLRKTGADAVVANDISQNDRGFGSDKNEVIVVSKNQQIANISLRLKREVAKEIIENLYKMEIL